MTASKRDLQTRNSARSAARRLNIKLSGTRKILGWEATRYGVGASPDLVEDVAGRISSSVRFRMEAAVAFAGAAPCRPPRCGIRLRLRPAGGPAAGVGSRILPGLRFLGRSDRASKAKRCRCATRRGDAFCRRRCHRSPAAGRCLVVSLGLIEWLDPTEVDHLFALGSQDHSFTAFGTALLGRATHPSRLCATFLWLENWRLRASISSGGGNSRNCKTSPDQPAEYLPTATAAVSAFSSVISRSNSGTISGRSIPRAAALRPNSGTVASISGISRSPTTLRTAIGWLISVPINHTR